MKTITATNCFLLSLLLVVAPLAYSQSGRQNKPDETIRLNTDLVVLDARVLNRKTQGFVGGLRKEDFELYEDGKRQYITHFNQETPPLSIVLLFNLDGWGPATFFGTRNNIPEVLQHLRPEDEMALMASKWDKIWRIQDFTRNKQLIADQSLWQNPWVEPSLPPYLTGIRGTSNRAVYEAALYAANASNPIGRRIIIAITDDVPYLTRSVIRDERHYDGSSSKKDTRSKDEIWKQLFTSEATVCALIALNPFFPSDLKEKMKALENHPGSKIIHLIMGYNRDEFADAEFYVERTGGEAMLVNEENAAAKLAEIIDHLYIRYSFGYVSSNQKRDGKFRRVKLKIVPAVEKREGEVTIITREGYYARRGNHLVNVRPEKQRAPTRP